MNRIIISSLTIVFSLWMLAACTVLSVDERVQQAERVAMQSGFIKSQIATDPFILTAFERIDSEGQVATVYIEGDGLAWLSRTKPSHDPTPVDPIALKLAVQDSSSKVIYLGRPCQFSKGPGCTQEYWTQKRFAPEAIAAMDSALEDIKQRYNITSFNLVGFSGGGAVAALLAAKRTDILSLRTVAGNLDIAAFSRIHNVSPMTGSLNPADVAETIFALPQMHFAGAEDVVVPPEIGNSFIAASKHPGCLKLAIIPGLSHEKGWVAIWPELLLRPLNDGCRQRR